MGISNNRKKIIKLMSAIEFFSAVIKKGDNNLLADLKIIIAILQHIAAESAASSPKYVLLII